MFIPILFILPFAYLIFRYKQHIEKYKDFKKLPGPSTKDIINLYRGKSSEGVLDYFQSLNKKYGPVVKIWIKPIPPIILTTDLEFFDKIYKSNEFFYTPAFSEVESLLRNGLASTKLKESWRNDKQIINKALTPSYISDSLVIYNKKYDEFIEKIYENLEKPIDLESNLQKIFSEIIIESMIDTQIKIKSEEINDYIKYKSKYMDLLQEKMNSINFGVFYKFTKNYRESLECAEKIIEIMEDILDRHKKIPKDLRENKLIYSLIDSGMSDDKIIDNMNTMMFGGFETSILPLSMTLYELSKRTELQEKILDEILSIVGPQSSRHISLEDLNNMTYLNCVVNEALRLFFQSPFVDRLVTQDIKVKDILIPKDTKVIFHISEIYKSEENFKNAKEFNPDRFLPENFTENVKKIFFPFGFGEKTCPGKNLGNASMKLFLAKILREFEIFPVKNHEIQLKCDVMFRSVNGIPVIFQKRMYELYM